MLARLKAEPAIVIGVIQAALVLLVAFGIDLSPEQSAAIIALAVAAGALFVRSKVTPLARINPEDMRGWELPH